MLGVGISPPLLMNQQSIPRRVRSILNKYSGSAYIAGADGVLRFGYQPGNYRESTGQTLAAADQQVGLVVDAARVPGPDLVDYQGGSWTYSAGHSRYGDVITINNGAQYSVSQQTTPISAGKLHSISYYIESISGGSVRAIFAGSSQVSGVSRSTVGWHTEHFMSVSGNTSLAIQVATSGGVSAVVRGLTIRELPGIHASQSTSGYQPVLRNTSGIRSWRFDGTDDRLSLSAVPFQMTDDHFVVAGARPDGSADKDIFSIRRTAATSPIIGLLRINAAGSLVGLWRDDAATALVSVSAIGAAGVGVDVVGSLRQVGDLRQVRANGGEWSSNTTSLGAATVDSATIGASATTTATNLFNGHIHGVIFGKGAIRDSELLMLERFMASLQGRQL